MKRAVNLLSLISLIAIIAGTILLIAGGNSDRYVRFISDWFMVPLLFLAIPLLGHSLSLAFNKDKIKPQMWLAIYGAMMFALLILLVFSWDSVSKQTMDLSYAFSKEHMTVAGEATNVRYSGGKTASQLFTIDNENFEITRSVFLDVKDGEIYTIKYLPNTKFIIDVLDENSSSLLKK